MAQKIEVDRGGSIIRTVEGRHHREDGPAIERLNGTKAWCIDGKFHREDGPAIEFSYGRNEWF